MASAKYGAVITDMKGKIGGTVFKGTKTGSVVQNKQNRSSAPKSNGKLSKADAGRVIQTQRNLGAVASAWRNLTPTERLAWVTAAPSFPFMNKFNEPYTGSGYQLYMQVNTNLLSVGEAVLAAPPAPQDLENCPAFTIADGVGVGQQYVWSGDVPAGYYLILSATSNISPGRQPQPGMFKAITIMDDSTGATLDVTNAYKAVFGEIPSGGNIWFSGKLSKADAGRTSQSYTFQYQY